MAKDKKVEETKLNAEITVNKTELLLEQVLGALVKLENSISRPITSQAETLRELPTQSPVAGGVVTAGVAIGSNPFENYVPADFRAVIDEVLSPEFDLKVEPHKDAPLITCTIIVPDKFSSMSPAQKELLHQDIRPKVITIPGGANELREFANLVFKNLEPNHQMTISAHRTVLAEQKAKQQFKEEIIKELK